MRNSFECQWVLVLIGILLVKAHLHIIRLLVVGLAGLGGLYMLHNLAQDFNKIQNSWNMGTGGLINQQLSNLFGMSSGRRRRSLEEDWLMEKFPNDTKVMSNLVLSDPMGCARKYVCHISAKSPKKQTYLQRKVLGILRTFRWLDSGYEWERAQDIGRLLGRRGGCEAAFHICGYTGRQLDNFMSALG